MTERTKLDDLQLALDVAGLEPTIGTGADAANVVISLLRAAKDKEPDERKKHLIDAGISAVSMIPFADVVKLLKLRKLRKVAVKGARAIKTGAKEMPKSYSDIQEGWLKDTGKWLKKTFTGGAKPQKKIPGVVYPRKGGPPKSKTDAERIDAWIKKLTNKKNKTRQDHLVLQQFQIAQQLQLLQQQITGLTQTKNQAVSAGLWNKTKEKQFMDSMNRLTQQRQNLQFQYGKIPVTPHPKIATGQQYQSSPVQPTGVTHQSPATYTVAGGALPAAPTAATATFTGPVSSPHPTRVPPYSGPASAVPVGGTPTASHVTPRYPTVPQPKPAAPPTTVTTTPAPAPASGVPPTLTPAVPPTLTPAGAPPPAAPVPPKKSKKTKLPEIMSNKELLKMLREIIDEEIKEGVGWVSPKDIHKDPKHTVNKTTGKDQRWTIKFASASDLSKHGDKEKTEVAEDVQELNEGLHGVQGTTPTEPVHIAELIGNLSPGDSVLFFTNKGIQGPMIRVMKRKAQPGQPETYEVEDQKRNKRTIDRESQIEKLGDIILSAKLTRYSIDRPPYQRTPGSLPLTETITKEELSGIIKELVNEMWVGWQEGRKSVKEYDKTHADRLDPEKCSKCGEEYLVTHHPNPHNLCPDCANMAAAEDQYARQDFQGNIDEGNMPEGQPIPKEVDKVADIIFRLKEGEYVWFSFDKIGRSGHGYGVEKKAEGDELVYRTTGEYGEYLEEDDDVVKFAQEVVNDKYAHYYFIDSIQGYKKSRRYDQDDDQQPGHYELYGPDPIRWQDVYEQKEMFREIVKQALNEIRQGS